MRFLLKSNNYSQNDCFFFISKGFRNSSSPRIFSESYMANEIRYMQNDITIQDFEEFRENLPSVTENKYSHKEMHKYCKKSSLRFNKFNHWKFKTSDRIGIIISPDSFKYSKSFYINEDLFFNEYVIWKLSKCVNPMSLYIFNPPKKRIGVIPHENLIENLIQKVKWLVELAIFCDSVNPDYFIPICITKNNAPYLKNIFFTGCSIMGSDLYLENAIIKKSTITDFNVSIKNFYSNSLVIHPDEKNLPKVFNFCEMREVHPSSSLPILSDNLKTLKLHFINKRKLFYSSFVIPPIPDNIKNFLVFSGSLRYIYLPKLPEDLEYLYLISQLGVIVTGEIPKYIKKKCIADYYHIDDYTDEEFPFYENLSL